MDPDRPEPLFQRIDCLQVPVPDLEAGLAFYRDRLGHRLLWRMAGSAGLALPGTEAELVIQVERPELEVNLLVDSAGAAAARFVAAGGEILEGPFDIPIGRCVLVHDPWGNRLVLLDLSRGALATDAGGNVIGNRKE